MTSAEQCCGLGGMASAEEPELAPFERRGFTVVEWGGKEILAE